MKYNGVSLPVLPGYSEAYACINESTILPGVYVLYVCSQPFYASSGNARAPSGAVLRASKLEGAAGIWGAFENMDSSTGTAGFGGVLWCDADIRYQDGTLYLAASEPEWELADIRRQFWLSNWLMGAVIRMAGKPVPAAGKRKPTAYLYNGVRLPVLPEQIKEYPYAAMEEYCAGGFPARCCLYCTSEPATRSAVRIYYRGPMCVFECVDGAWVLNRLDHDDLEVLTVNHKLFWANHDIRVPGGTAIRLAASEPVPVYS